MVHRHYRHPIVLVTVAILTALFSVSCASGVSEEEAADVYYDLGNAYFDLLQFDDAVKAYSKALELNPKILQAGYNLARVYIETGQIDRGISVLEDLLEEDPVNTDVLATLSWAKFRQDDLAGALSGYKKVLELVGNSKDALFNVAVISWKMGNLVDAAEYFKAYHREYPETGNLELLGSVYLELDDVENALRYYELYAADVKPSVEVLILMAGLYEDAEEYGKAASLYAEALDRDSSLKEQRFSYAKILLEKIEDYKSGMEQLKISLDSGYDDRDSLSDLLANARSYYRDDLQIMLNENGLLGDPESLDEGA